MHHYTPLTEQMIKSVNSETSEPVQPPPHVEPGNVLVDIFSDEPLLCPYQRAGIQDGEDCEACQ